MKARKHTLILMTIGLLAVLDPVEARSPEEARYEPPGVGMQILGGAAYGSGGILLGGTSGAILYSMGCYQWGEDCGFAGLFGALIGGASGFALASPLGVYRFGVDENVSGSWRATYGSALLASAIGFGGWAFISRLDDSDDVFQAAILATLASPVGALIGFNASRRLQDVTPQVSFHPRLDGGWAGRLSWSFE